MKNKRPYESARPYFQKILKDKEIRTLFEEEKLKTDIAYVVRSVRLKAGLTQAVISRLESGVDNRIPNIYLLIRIA